MQITIIVSASNSALHNPQHTARSKNNSKKMQAKALETAPPDKPTIPNTTAPIHNNSDKHRTMTIRTKLNEHGNQARHHNNNNNQNTTTTTTPTTSGS
jgi:hypothetical protein